MRKFPPSLEAWRDPIEKTINKTLKANFDRREANQIIKYMFRTGGKRCRPLLVVLSAEALGGRPEEALEAAAAIEIIHAATLVFDDMIDKDQVRIGAAIAGVDGRNLVGVQKFGRSSGMAFQIQDDILDFTDGSDEPVLKAPNIVTSHCLHEAPRPSSNIELLNSNRKPSNREVLKILRKAGSLEFAKLKAKEYAGNAKESLDKVTGLENRKILDDYADYLWKRTE